MVQYILECIAFQLVFLIIYDFFLKRETFFQWNRFYLIGTYVLSMVLPWIKIEALKTTVPDEYYVYPEFLWNTNDNATTVVATESQVFNISWEEGIIYGGMLLATLYFGFKLYQIQKLRRNGSVQYFPDFTRVIVENSELAFSFFKSIFLGDKVIAREHEGIIKHELVHIEQRHSWDLLFFELMRIVGWFNPLVYVYQSRISELHEFIADAKVAKTHKREQYEFLLSQVFQTENISFVNQFFKSSLIKKRIVMLQKSKSKNVWQLKYLLLVPMIIGMLFYSSLEAQKKDDLIQEQTIEDAELIEKANGKNQSFKIDVPFATVDEVPVFPGCEGDADKRGCFHENMRNHIRKNFNYPKEAQEQGLQGRVAIMFTMNTEGGIANVKVRGPHKLLEDEAVRIISKLPKLKPGVHEGNKVNVSFSIPISFSLTGNKDKSEQDDFMAKYQELLAERERLLKREDEKSPIIDNLDQQLRTLKQLIEAEGQVKPKSGNDLMTKYQELFMERNRLVKTANENNPIIVNLDQQLKTIKEQILENHDGTVPFAWIDEAPIFPGCEDSENTRECFQKSMQKHISKNFRYPIEAQEKGIQGRVNIMFTISEDGTIQNVRMRGPDKLLEGEAARIIGLLPKMSPGKQKGENVNVPFSIPITFKLQGGDEQEAIKIKAYNSIDPIYIVDKVQISKDEFEKLNHPDIELIRVFKDKGAIEKYGQEAKNGVFEIKMKSNHIIKLPFKNDVKPIYIVDGVETSKEDFEKLNQNNIESIHVLKDEAAIKKYGKEAKNGVIEIKMKK